MATASFLPGAFRRLFRGSLFRGPLFGFPFGFLLHALRQLLAAGLAVPLLVGFRRDLAGYQQLGELTSLGFALEWHDASSIASRLGGPLHHIADHRVEPGDVFGRRW